MLQAKELEGLALLAFPMTHWTKNRGAEQEVSGSSLVCYRVSLHVDRHGLQMIIVLCLNQVS